MSMWTSRGKKLDEFRKRGAREGRNKVLNKLTEDQRKELKKRETMTCARRNITHVSLPQALVHPPQKKQDPSQPIKEAPPKLTEKVSPPLVRDLLLRPKHEYKEIELNIDVPTMIGKMNMLFLVLEM